MPLSSLAREGLTAVCATLQLRTLAAASTTRRSSIRHPVHGYLALLLRLVENLEQPIHVLDSSGGRMEKVKFDSLPAESAEATVNAAADVFRVQVVGRADPLENFLDRLVEVTHRPAQVSCRQPAFRGDREPVRPAAHRGTEPALARGRSVRVCSIDERDAEIGGGIKQPRYVVERVPRPERGQSRRYQDRSGKPRYLRWW